MDIELTTDKSQIKRVMMDPKLFYASMSDEDIVLYEQGQWEPGSDCSYLIASHRHEPVAVVRLYQVCNLTVDMHAHLDSRYWGTGLSRELSQAIEQYLIDQTYYRKILVQTPDSCRAVLKALIREGYTFEGVLTAAICWRNAINNLILMTKFLEISHE